MENDIQNTLTITIFRASDGDGFMYDIYDCEASEIDGQDSLDGGQCTSDDMEDALEMAYEQAMALAVKPKK